MKWLNRNDFATDDYNWDNEEINLYLNKSLDQKKIAKGITGLGVGSMVIGTMIYYVSLLIDDKQKSKNGESAANKYFIASGAFFTTAVVLRSASLRNLKIAKKLKRLNN